MAINRDKPHLWKADIARSVDYYNDWFMNFAPEAYRSLNSTGEPMPKQILQAHTALYPLPVVLVSCGIERPNIITLAWVGTVASSPPTVGIGVRPNRHSHGLIQETGEFVVNLPTLDMLSAVDQCGTLSGRDHDKFELCGLTAAPSSKVRVPQIAQAPINLECVVRQTVSVGSHDLFLGEIAAVQIDRAILDADGRVDYGRAGLLLYAGGTYHTLGDAVRVRR